MTRIPRAIVDEVDALVVELDTATIAEPFTAPATSSWKVIAAAWHRFKSLVDALDEAVAAPLAANSPKAFVRAHGLVGDEAYRLSFWLTHVGVAIARRRRSSRPGRTK